MKWYGHVWDFIIPLVSERNDEGQFKRASLGRIAFWITFGIAVYVWSLGTGDVQPSHMQMLYIMVTYNLMKKAPMFDSTRTPNTKVEPPIKEEMGESLRRK